MLPSCGYVPVTALRRPGSNQIGENREFRIRPARAPRLSDSEESKRPPGCILSVNRTGFAFGGWRRKILPNTQQKKQGRLVSYTKTTDISELSSNPSNFDSLGPPLHPNVYIAAECAYKDLMATPPRFVSALKSMRPWFFHGNNDRVINTFTFVSITLAWSSIVQPKKDLKLTHVNLKPLINFFTSVVQFAGNDHTKDLCGYLRQFISHYTGAVFFQRIHFNTELKVFINQMKLVIESTLGDGLIVDFYKCDESSFVWKAFMVIAKLAGYEDLLVIRDPYLFDHLINNLAPVETNLECVAETCGRNSIFFDYDYSGHVELECSKRCHLVYHFNCLTFLCSDISSEQDCQTLIGERCLTKKCTGIIGEGFVRKENGQLPACSDVLQLRKRTKKKRKTNVDGPSTSSVPQVIDNGAAAGGSATEYESALSDAYHDADSRDSRIDQALDEVFALVKAAKTRPKYLLLQESKFLFELGQNPIVKSFVEENGLAHLLKRDERFCVLNNELLGLAKDEAKLNRVLLRRTDARLARQREEEKSKSLAENLQLVDRMREIHRDYSDSEYDRFKEICISEIRTRDCLSTDATVSNEAVLDYFTDAELECRICLEPMQPFDLRPNPAEIHRSPCCKGRHMLHASCYSKCMKTDKRCPGCFTTATRQRS